MSMPKYDPIYTIDQYLAIDRASEERLVYLDGQIFLMAGESGAHADISVNVAASLHTQLLDSPCRVRITPARKKSTASPRREPRANRDWVGIAGPPFAPRRGLAVR